MCVCKGGMAARLDDHAVGDEEEGGLLQRQRPRVHPNQVPAGRVWRGEGRYDGVRSKPQMQWSKAAVKGNGQKAVVKGRWPNAAVQNSGQKSAVKAAAISGQRQWSKGNA